jgi:ferrous iron transport protein A
MNSLFIIFGILILAIFLIFKSTKKLNKCDGCIKKCNITLDQLEKGKCAIILNIEHTGNISRRLADMGVVPGQRICLIRKSPLGDPLEYCIMGYCLALRKEEAKSIHIRLE